MNQNNISPLGKAYKLLILWANEENEQDAAPVKNTTPCCNRCDKENLSQSECTTDAGQGQRGSDV